MGVDPRSARRRPAVGPRVAGRSNVHLATRVTSESDPLYERDATQSDANWPTIEALEQRLSQAMSEGVRVSARVVSRTPNSFSSTFPTEIVTCQIGSQPAVRLFCKHFHADLGQEFGKGTRPFHEIDVYKQVLTKVPTPTPGFAGSWISDDSTEGLLVLKYLDDSRRLSHTGNYDNGLEAAAVWIGEFHRHAAALATRPELGFLERSASQFYRDVWARLVAKRGSLSGAPAWLRRLGDRFELVLAILHDADPTVIHGEYYPKNVLLHEGRIFPVDWETASIGMGEMDLATLVDGWPRAVDRCVSAYATARGFSPDDREFRRRLGASQILINAYWLSYGEHWSSDPKKLDRASRRLDRMHHAAEQIGLLS
jgi:thiamine kinase-like enzyme